MFMTPHLGPGEPALPLPLAGIVALAVLVLLLAG